MPYLNSIKANSDIFEQIKFINVQDKFILKPIIPDMLKMEAMIYHINCQNDEIKKYLPGAYVATPEQAQAKLIEHIDRMLAYDGLLYCIRPINEQIPIGYIMLNSPISSTGIPQWTIDFWMNERYRRQGIMGASVSSLFAHLQHMDVEEIYALVDKSNVAAIALLEWFEFQVQEIEKGGNRFVYSFRLIN